MTETIKVLMISGDYPPMISGMGDYAYHLAHSLQRLNVDVTVLTSNHAADYSDAPQGPRILRTIASWDRNGIESVLSQVEAHCPQVVHLQFMNITFQNQWGIYTLGCKLKKRFPHVKLITTFHEFAAPFGRAFLVPLLMKSNAYVVTNEHHFKKLEMIKKLLFLKQPLLKIPLAATVPPIEGYRDSREATRSQLGFLQEELVLLRFGIIHSLSAPEIIRTIKILSHLRKRNIPARLLLIGKNDSGMDSINNEIQTLNLGEFVSIKADLAPDFISAYLFASDIGLALYPDGVSEKRTAFLSMLAHGLPVIGIKTPIFPSELEDGKNVITVPPQATDEQWISAIQRLAGDKQLRTSIGEAGSFISRLHQWPRIAESTKNLYQTLLR